MDILTAPARLRAKIGDDGAEALVTMFAEAHRIAMEGVERRLRELEERFERRLSDLRFDLLKWSFLFWIGQLAAMTAILNLMLRGLR